LFVERDMLLENGIDASHPLGQSTVYIDFYQVINVLTIYPDRSGPNV